YFMMFNASMSVLDGANVSAATFQSFVFPEIEPDGFTRFHAANPSDAEANLVFQLIGSEGNVRATVARKINANGAEAELLSELFPGITPSVGDYVRVASDRGVVPFELLGKSGRYIAGLNGQDADAGAVALYSPQFALGGGWRSALSIVNL